MKLSTDSENLLIEISVQKKIHLEGNILKILDTDNENFRTYLNKSIELDDENRKKRITLSKQIQDRNVELELKQSQLEQKQNENNKLLEDLNNALFLAEKAKLEALNEVSVLQTKNQFELIGTIVKIALCVIVGVGIIVTSMYVFAMSKDSTETTLIGNTWSNLFGILLTNSFSIIGTIMGVKYATEQEK